MDFQLENEKSTKKMIEKFVGFYSIFQNPKNKRNHKIYWYTNGGLTGE